MATKSKVRPISMADCVRALEEYNSRLFMLLNLMPTVIEFVKDNKGENERYADYLASKLEESMAAINEFRNAEV
jgi:hypothetical protein